MTPDIHQTWSSLRSVAMYIHLDYKKRPFDGAFINAKGLLHFRSRETAMRDTPQEKVKGIILKSCSIKVDAGIGRIYCSSIQSRNANIGRTQNLMGR